MKFYSQSFLHDDPWSIVSLAYLRRYPNPYATHVISCDVISREITLCGSLVTTRLILKSGSLPRWFPKGMVSRAETWMIEESEVDPLGKVTRCSTRNLDNVKIMRAEEHVQLQHLPDGKTLYTTEARILSGFGWGLTKRIENYGLTRFRQNLQKSREGLSVILNLIRQSRVQPMTMGGSIDHAAFVDSHRVSEAAPSQDDTSRGGRGERPAGAWSKIYSWVSTR